MQISHAAEKLEGQQYFWVKVTLNVSKSFFRWIPLDIPHFGLVDTQLRFDTNIRLLFVTRTPASTLCSSPKPEMLQKVPLYLD